MSLARTPFGTTRDGRPVDRFTLTNAGTNASGMSVSFLSYGGVITEITVPDRAGRPDNVVLGFPTLAEYETSGATIYFGALIGRYANRIAKGRFTLDGQAHALAINNAPNTLHGGRVGFDKQVWSVASHAGNAATLTHTSPDGDENFPGTLDVAVTYTLTDADGLRIDYRATTDRPTVVNLTNHSYFNLAGNGAGSIEGHLLMVNAEHITPVDADLIPTGELAPVAGTPFDFRAMMPIGARLRSAHPQMAHARGYDHNFVLTKPGPDVLSFAARAYDPRSGRVLDCFTTQPGLQVYTGNFLEGTAVGSAGTVYRQGDGITLETQHFPDSPNHPHFPSTTLLPGGDYRATTIFRFATDDAMPDLTPPA